MSWQMQSKVLSTRLMGNGFVFEAVDDSLDRCDDAVNMAAEEVQRIEHMLTTYSNQSVTAEVNASAGTKPVQVPEEFYNLVLRCQKISSLTQGAFDITYGSVDKALWNFDIRKDTLPTAAKALKKVHLVDYKNVILNEGKQTIFLKEKGMRIGFGGIGKGYAADMARKKMQGAGINHGLVNAAGDLTAWGFQKDGRPWTIGIADPARKDAVFSSFPISGLSVATSGDYEKFSVIDGQHYSHTIDPRTGMPAKGLHSVTIICSVAELADALTTPVLIMGVEAGLHLINQLQGVEAILMDHRKQIFFSNKIRIC